MKIRVTLCLAITFAALALAADPKATPEEARKFINDAEQKLLLLNIDAGRADWIKATYITDDTESIAAKLDEKAISAAVAYAKQATRFDGLKLDAETAVRAYNGIRVHVPLLNALAANSPFWFGADSGLASSRTVIFRSYPRAAMAPEFDDFEHFCRVTHQVCTAGRLEDYTHIWWDARIHPGLGTIEVRATDAQFDLRRAAALSALVHCLTRLEAERDQSDIPAREALAESSFQATRHGLDAQLLSRRGDLVPARDLARHCVADAGTVAGELDCEEELGYVETILDEGPGADLQRRVHRQEGMTGLLAYLVRETARLGVNEPLAK